MVEINGNGAVTRAELKTELEALEQRFERRLDERLLQLEEKLMEVMRDMQTELLRGFAAYNIGMIGFDLAHASRHEAP